ncbi:hypothetical protein SUGI_0253690 [Cryptomeria japonica]|nr:hypothetical protein SUGI_0253690 [Cryptomeria japonica]
MENYVKILAILFCLIGSSRGARTLLQKAPDYHPHLNTGIFCHEADMKLCSENRTRDCGTKKECSEPENVVGKSILMSGSRLNGRRLSKSKHSSPVGHMQVYNAGKKRVLKSTPSPGVGH